MAVIDFRNWRIQSDAECWTLGKPKTRLNPKKQREIYLERPTYYATLNAALQGLLERELREADTQTAAELLALMQEIRQAIKGLAGV